MRTTVPSAMLAGLLGSVWLEAARPCVEAVELSKPKTMNRPKLRMACWLAGLALLADANVGESVTLESGFAQPPPEARPWVFWMWLRVNTTPEAITEDLQEMHAKGIAGAILYNSGVGGNPNFSAKMVLDGKGYRVVKTEAYAGGPIDPIARPALESWTPHSRALVRFAAKEAGRLGIKLCLTIGLAGTSGPIAPEYGQQKLVWSETTVTGPQSYAAPLPAPDTEVAYTLDPPQTMNPKRLRPKTSFPDAHPVAEPAGPNTSQLDPMKDCAGVDVAMGEYWVPSVHRPTPPRRFMLRAAASANHIYGKPLTPCESLTSVGPFWEESFFDLKNTADQAFCDGCNLTVIHNWSHSPSVTAKPGYAYFAGTLYSRNTTWWEETPAFNTYLGRCSYMLQQGLFVADALYYRGDGIGQGEQMKSKPALPADGYDHDNCNLDALLTRVSAETGRLVLPDGMSYRILVLRDNSPMPLEALESANSPRPRRCCHRAGLARSAFSLNDNHNPDGNAQNSMKPQLPAFALLSLILAGNGLAQEAKPLAERQQEFLSWKFGMFRHYNVATYNERQWANGHEDPATFAPAQLDCGQWADAAKAAGMKYAVLTVKHTGGWCLWDSQSIPAAPITEESLGWNTPWPSPALRAPSPIGWERDGVRALCSLSSGSGSTC